MPYLTFELEDGTKVSVEATDMQRSAPGLIPAGRGNEEEKTPLLFIEKISGVRKMATTLVEQFRQGFGDQPSDVDISFGIKASAELGGFVVARAGGETSFSVTLRWRAKEDEKKAE
jgi:hypothetical protein